MGDLVGEAVAGTLYYAAKGQLDRVRASDAPVVARTQLFADLCRLNTLYMIARAGSGHIGSCFSSMDIVSLLQLEVLRDDPKDLYYSSKGHDAPGLYAVLMGVGKLDFEQLHVLRQLGGLPGHPDVSTPHIVTNTGSLGMGISKAKGMVFARRMRGESGTIYVMTGDGELQEGQIWESLVSAKNHGLHEIVAIVDHNKLQSDTFVEKTSDLGDLEAKFKAFGWHVRRVDGHDIGALQATLEELSELKDLPKMVIADTIKGKGVSFMEHTAMESDVELYRFHSGAPTADAYTRAAQEIIDRINGQAKQLGLPGIELETVERPAKPAGPEPEKLIAAYARALEHQVTKNEHAVVLDADLCLDTGQMPAREKAPERFLECGIAEMDMVSQAGGMALEGALPLVHSFACFLSTRPNEHIYNNATEHTKVVYTASLAGMLPGGPGHSHQSVRDISALAAVPGLVMAEPCCEAEVPKLFDYLVNGTRDSGYLRLVSVPYVTSFELPSDYRAQEGRGCVLRDGKDAVMFGYGIVLLSEACKAADELAKSGIGLRVVNLPWLNRFDSTWVLETIGDRKRVFTLDNHYLIGGQGDGLCSVIAQAGKGVPVSKLALSEVPACGSNPDVLRHHGLDAASIAQRVREELS